MQDRNAGMGPKLFFLSFFLVGGRGEEGGGGFTISKESINRPSGLCITKGTWSGDGVTRWI